MDHSLHLACYPCWSDLCRGYRLGFNSLCAFASVNHLHYHAYYLEHELVVEHCVRIQTCMSQDCTSSEASWSLLLYTPVTIRFYPGFTVSVAFRHWVELMNWESANFNFVHWHNWKNSSVVLGWLSCWRDWWNVNWWNSPLALHPFLWCKFTLPPHNIFPHPPDPNPHYGVLCKYDASSHLLLCSWAPSYIHHLAAFMDAQIQVPLC